MGLGISAPNKSLAGGDKTGARPLRMFRTIKPEGESEQVRRMIHMTGFKLLATGSVMICGSVASLIFAVFVEIILKDPNSPLGMVLVGLMVFLLAAGKSWSRKSEQGDKWSFCLIAGTLCPANQERP